jgi:hypothetical protein
MYKKIFIAYSFINDIGEIGFGNATVNPNNYEIGNVLVIDDMDKIKILQDYIKENKKYRDVVITNWKYFK